MNYAGEIPPFLRIIQGKLRLPWMKEVCDQMQIIAIIWLALLIGITSASAQVTYSLKVSRHPSVSFSDQQVDQILADASKMLQKDPHHADATNNVACNVTLQRVGPVQVLSANAPAVIKNQSDRDAVHRENPDSDPNVISVKIVKKIEFCRPQQGNSFVGCSWPHSFHSIIVVADQKSPKLVWPHEFGHHTGLWHRKGLNNALMSPCTLKATNVQVTKSECSCLLAGPGGCKTSEPKPPVTCSP
jgi:hypothetical protein